MLTSLALSEGKTMMSSQRVPVPVPLPSHYTDWPKRTSGSRNTGGPGVMLGYPGGDTGWGVEEDPKN